MFVTTHSVEHDLGRSILGSGRGLTLCKVLQLSVEVESSMGRGGLGGSSNRMHAVEANVQVVDKALETERPWIASIFFPLTVRGEQGWQ